jgi:hypothetical protein
VNNDKLNPSRPVWGVCSTGNGAFWASWKNFAAWYEDHGSLATGHETTPTRAALGARTSLRGLIEKHLTRHQELPEAFVAAYFRRLADHTLMAEQVARWTARIEDTETFTSGYDELAPYMEEGGFTGSI